MVDLYRKYFLIMKKTIVNEFHFRVFDESYERIYKCLSMLDEKDIWKSPQGNIPCVGCLILHLCGNARQWVLSGLGDIEDNRNRDDEFIIHQNIRKAELIFLMENMKAQLRECLIDMDELLLNQRIQIQGFNVTGFSALVHVIEHFSYHTGQITTLTKLITNVDTGYYQDFNLNRLN